MNPEPELLLRFGIHSVCPRGTAIGERDCGAGEPKICSMVVTRAANVGPDGARAAKVDPFTITLKVSNVRMLT